MVTTPSMHTVSASTFWLPCMTLHHACIILLMVMDHATLRLSHRLDSKLYPCDLISNPRHYAVSRPSPWWTCVMLHSICVILLITFDPKLCLCHGPHDTIKPDAILCLHPLCDNHRWLWTCQPLWVRVPATLWLCHWPDNVSKAFPLSHLSDSHVWCYTYV